MYQLATRRVPRSTAAAPAPGAPAPGRATLAAIGSSDDPHDDTAHALARELAVLEQRLLPRYASLCRDSVESLQHEIERVRTALQVRHLITTCTARIRVAGSAPLRAHLEAIVTHAHTMGVFAECP